MLYMYYHVRENASPWQRTRGTQCTCRSSRRSPWQQLRSTKRIWTWAPGRSSSPKMTRSWTHQRHKSVFICVCVCVRACVVVPVVIGEAWPPVGRPQEGLETTGQVHEQITHQEEPEMKKEIISEILAMHTHTHTLYTHTQLSYTYIVRMGATRSSEAMRIPSSAIRAVSSRAQVGSPLAFPWPKTCHQQRVKILICFWRQTIISGFVKMNRLLVFRFSNNSLRRQEYFTRKDWLLTV